MTEQTKDIAVQQQPTDNSLGTVSPFSSIQGFEIAQRMAGALAASDIVPQQFQGNKGNLLIAMELANRTKSSIMAVMQNLYVVHGKPSWSAAYCIAAINQSGRFSEPLHFEFQGEEDTDDWGCRACTRSKSGKEVKGPLVTIAMAKAEGWYGKGGSKWKTMPELMLRYRAAAFFARTEAPDLLFGMQTEEELRDINPPYDVGQPATEMIAEAEIIKSVKAKVDTNASFKDRDDNPGPSVTFNDPEEDEGPKWDKPTDAWVDAHGVTYDPSAHASFTGKHPIMNADGSFKARRGAANLAAELRAKAERGVTERKSASTITQMANKSAEKESDVEPGLITITGQSGVTTSRSPCLTVTGQSGVTTTEEPLLDETQEQPARTIDGDTGEPSNLAPFLVWKAEVSEAKTMDDLFAAESSLDALDKSFNDEGNIIMGKRYQEMVKDGLLSEE